MILAAGLTHGSSTASNVDPHLEQSHSGSGTPVLITKASPSLQFFEEGKMYFEAIPGSISIFIDFKDLNERLIVAEDAARDIMAAKGGNISDFLADFESTEMLLEAIINFFGTEESAPPPNAAPIFSRTWADDPQALDLRSPSVLQDHLVHLDDMPTVTKGETHSELPEPRILGAMVSGAIGLINTIKEKATKKIAEGNTKAIQRVSEVVDGLREYSVSHGEYIDSILAKIAVQEALGKKAALKDYWERTRRLIHEVANVAHGVLNNKLSPSILHFLNMENVWKGFKLKVEQEDWVVPFQHALHLFEMPTTFVGTAHNVLITTHIPLKQRHATSWTILRFVQRPFLHGHSLIEILPLASLMAVDLKTKAHIDMAEEVLKACDVVNDQYFCPDEVRVIAKSASSCLSAVWLGNFHDIEDFCFLRLRSARPVAWALSSTSFIIISPNEAKGNVKCPHEVATTVKLVGYQQVTLQPGCSLLTSHFSLYAGNDTGHHQVHINVSAEDAIQLMEELFSAYHEDAGSTIHVPRPMGISTVALESNRIFRDARRSKFFTPALAVSFSFGLAALLALMGFILFLYFKAKFPGCSVLRLVGLCCSRWRGTPRQDEHVEDPIPQVDGGDLSPDSSDTEQYFSPHDSEALLQLPSRGSGPFSHPIRTAFVEGVRAEVDVDQGAPVTVLARDFFNMLPAYFRRMRVPDHMRDLPFFVPFAARVWIMHNGHMHWLLCAVSDDLFFADAILGRDWHSLIRLASPSTSSGSGAGNVTDNLPLSQSTSDSDEVDLIDLADTDDEDCASLTWKESRHTKRDHSSSDEEEGWTRVTRRVKWRRTWQSHWASF